MGGLACKTKIILNGATVQNELRELCYLVQEDNSIDDKAGYAIVDQLNIAEDAVFKAKRLYLEMKGFRGPWPASLGGGGTWLPESPS